MWTLDSITKETDGTARINVIWRKGQADEFAYSESVDLIAPAIRAFCTRAKAAKNQAAQEATAWTTRSATLKTLVETELNR